MRTVARLYRFRASHSLPGVAGYDQPHEHDYTIEVAVTAPADDDGMVVDTQLLDDQMEPLVELWQGCDLNRKVRRPTTVENLAEVVRGLFTLVIRGDIQVTVWEDNDRWGRA